MASRLQAFSSVAAADRKWPSGPVPHVSNGRNVLGYPRIVAIHRENTSATPGTVAEKNYFRFAAATVKNCYNQLCKPQTIEIRRENTPDLPGTA